MHTLSTYTYINTCIHIHIFIHMHTHKITHSYTLIHILIHRNTIIYVHIHILVHIYTHHTITHYLHSHRDTHLSTYTHTHSSHTPTHTHVPYTATHASGHMPLLPPHRSQSHCNFLLHAMASGPPWGPEQLLPSRDHQPARRVWDAPLWTDCRALGEKVTGRRRRATAAGSPPLHSVPAATKASRDSQCTSPTPGWDTSGTASFQQQVPAH